MDLSKYGLYPITTEGKWQAILNIRDNLLKSYDWIYTTDAVLTQTEKDSCRTYRDALRNIEFLYSNPDDVVLPDPPTILSTIQTPEVASARIELNNNIAQLKSEYISTISTLQSIEDAVSPTNAQVVAAVKFLAKTLRLLLRLIARQYS